MKTACWSLASYICFCPSDKAYDKFGQDLDGKNLQVLRLIYTTMKMRRFCVKLARFMKR